MLLNSHTHRFLILVLIGMISQFRPDCAFAQSDSRIDRSFRLVASRYGQDIPFAPGTRLCIKYNRGGSEIKERGYFAGALDNKIILTPDKAGSYRIVIPPEDIIYVRKIKPIHRIIAGTAGLAMMTGGVLVFESISSTASAMGAALIGFPLVAAGVVFIYYVPISLILEKINEKKRSKGWDFQLSKKQ